MKRIWIALTTLILSSALSAHAAVTEKTIEYKDGKTVLEGFVAYPENAKNAPGVVVVHAWMGLDDYTKKRARMLAELGYVAFAADIYGKGVRPANSKEASELATKYRSGDRKDLRRRTRLALDQLRKLPQVNKKKVAAIGYCFGGTAALELARSGADLNGVISFHGNLSTPNPKDAKRIKGKVLVLHGADDPFVPVSEVTAFQEEMRSANVDWHMVSYGGAVHSFTHFDQPGDPKSGAAYNEKADKRSWEAMKTFFGEIF